MTKRAILYARVSGSDKTNATSSIDGQLAECRKYAQQRGYTILSEVYEEPEKYTSGADWLPELDKLLRLAPSGTYDVIVCREVDRLARNRFKQLATEIELESHGVTVEYVIGQFEDSDEGRLLKGMVSEFAEYERNKIRRRTYSGTIRAVEDGNVTTGGSAAPYGYDLVTVNGKRTLVINEVEAEIVRTIFQLYTTKQLSIYSIRDYLVTHGVPLPVKGKNHRARSKLTVWSMGTIRGMLMNSTYVGTWHYRKTRRKKNPVTGKAHNVPRPQEEWIAIGVPAIISVDTYNTAQQKREANKLQLGRQRTYEYALTGMMECGLCHHAFLGISKIVGGRIYSSYKCASRHSPKKYGSRCDNTIVKARVLEPIVWQWIKSLLLEPEALRQAIDEYQEAQSQRMQPQLAMLESSQARLVELGEQKTRLINAYSKGILSLDELASQKTALDRQISDLGQAVAHLRAETEPQLLTVERIESIEAFAQQMRGDIGIIDDNKQAQRAIYQVLDVHVVITTQDGQCWADVTCALGNTVSAVENTISADSKTSNQRTPTSPRSPPAGTRSSRLARQSE